MTSETESGAPREKSLRLSAQVERGKRVHTRTEANARRKRALAQTLTI